jgi:hypothetical protein
VHGGTVSGWQKVEMRWQGTIAGATTWVARDTGEIWHFVRNGTNFDAMWHYVFCRRNFLLLFLLFPDSGFYWGAACLLVFTLVCSFTFACTPVWREACAVALSRAVPVCGRWRSGEHERATRGGRVERVAEHVSCKGIEEGTIHETGRRCRAGQCAATTSERAGARRDAWVPGTDDCKSARGARGMGAAAIEGSLCAGQEGGAAPLEAGCCAAQRAQGSGGGRESEEPRESIEGEQIAGGGRCSRWQVSP